jgi:hypothetical protein
MLTDDQEYLLNTYRRQSDRVITVMPAEIRDAAQLVAGGYLERVEIESGVYKVKVK